MAFQYTFRSDDIESFDASTRDLLENRDRELELHTSTIDTSFLNLNASNLASGTVPSSRVTGAYTGITQVGTLTAGVASYSIGDTGPAGGKVFITPSTSGNTSGLYFEIAPISAEVQRTWSQFAPINYTSTSVPLAQFNNIGTGKSNTVAIVNQGNSNTDTCAAKYCDAFTYGGFSDWFLPSLNELNQVYVNRVVLGNDFNSSFYWSSSQSSASGGAWAQEFGAGSQSNNNKINTHYVRPVRSFSTIGLNVVGSAVVRTAATQDGVLLTGRAGGTSDYVVSILPTTLNGNRTVTLPDVTGTMITTGNLSSITSVGTLSSLDVSGTISNLNGRMELGLGRVSSGNAYVDLIGDTTYSDYGLRLIRYETGANTPSELIHRGTGTLSIIAKEAAKMVFSTTNNQRMIIDSAGNVGIGDNEPSLHGLLSVGASIGASTIKNMISMFSIDGYDATTMRIAGYAWTGVARTAIDFVQNGSTNFNSQIVFSTSAGAGAVERMRINGAGNVGIGVTTPSAKLDIIGAQIIRAGSTQDGIGLQGRPGGTSSWSVLLYPATLTASRTLTLPDVSGTVVTTTDFPSSFRNKIINGDMRVDQRGSASTAVTTSNYVTDRWYNEDGCDAVFSAQQSTDVPTGQGFAKSLKVTATTADASIGSTQFAVISQHIEGHNFADLAWGSANAKQVVVSFWVKATVTGTYSLTLYNNGASRILPTAYTISASNTWENKTVVIAGDTSGTWLTDTGRGVSVNFYTALGSSYLGTSGVWNGSSIYGVTGQANAWASVSNVFAITGVQLEKGGVATPFEQRPIQTELALCQRYYYRFVDGTSQPIGLGMYTFTSLVAFYVIFPVTMRIAPVLVSSTGTNYYVAAQGFTADYFNSVTTSQMSNKVAYIYNGTEVSASAGAVYSIYSNDTNASIAFNAEL